MRTAHFQSLAAPEGLLSIVLSHNTIEKRNPLRRKGFDARREELAATDEIRCAAIDLKSLVL
jgi:hypothetical protein